MVKIIQVILFCNIFFYVKYWSWWVHLQACNPWAIDGGLHEKSRHAKAR